jgi:hypothetical protein
MNRRPSAHSSICIEDAPETLALFILRRRVNIPRTCNGANEACLVVVESTVLHRSINQILDDRRTLVLAETTPQLVHRTEQRRSTGPLIKDSGSYFNQPVVGLDPTRCAIRGTPKLFLKRSPTVCGQSRINQSESGRVVYT